MQVVVVQEVSRLGVRKRYNNVDCYEATANRKAMAGEG